LTAALHKQQAKVK